jgi:primosomal protein N' (replication factor Y)
LRAALRAALDRGEQALVFRNRRGFAPCLLCHDCGWHADCARCDSALTLHGRARLLCHHCGARRSAPSACPECGGLGLVPQGSGTERLEQGLATAFPGVPLIRVDRETTQHRDALQAHFSRLGDAPGILVGTQMLAKGHDLPNLTLVAIASIDDGLFSADFRATERLAQLLLQVAGRAGRAQRPGQVWLQTHHPGHPLLQTLLQGGYAAFADGALAEREAAGFPPFAHLALLRAEANAEPVLDDFLAAAHACAAAHAVAGVEVLPPMPAPMPRRAGRLRGQLLLSAAHRPALQALLRAWMPDLHALREARQVRWSVDVDPIDLY